MQLDESQFVVAFCTCNRTVRTPRKVCRANCYCTMASIVCAAGCPCQGLCHQGQPSRPRVEVRPSLIPGAGDGCFAIEDIPQGFVIDEYRGDIMPLVKAERRRGGGGRFLADIESPKPDHSHLVVVVDAKSKAPCTRANHSERFPNAYAEKMKARVDNNSRVSQSLYVRADRFLQAGEEIFWDYGPSYPTEDFVEPQPPVERPSTARRNLVLLILCIDEAIHIRRLPLRLCQF